MIAFLLSLVALYNQHMLVNALEWSTCPPSQSGQYLKDCTNITYPLNRDDPSMGNVTAFVRRMYSDQPTNNSIWMIEGGPGFSTRGFIETADFLIGANPNFTIYLQDQRGTGLSSPVNCQGDKNPPFYFDPYNASMLEEYSTCNRYVIDTYGTDLQYYSTNHGAADLRDTINTVNPGKVGIYALSYGTFFANTYLQLDSARADCLILDGPVPANRWVMENNAVWNSRVSQDLINTCVGNSSVCEDNVKQMGHTPQFIVDSIVDGTLPCLKNLSWLNATNGQHIVASFTNTMTATQANQPLLAPFWNRLYRCSASDIEQLNTFYKNNIDGLYYSSPMLDYSYGLAITVGGSEVYSYAGDKALTYDDQVLLTSRLFSDAGGEFTTSYARNTSGYPLYTPDPATYMKFARPDMTTIILVGTLDPNTPYGLGPWLQQGLGENATLLTVPYAVHGTFNYYDSCVQSIVIEFFSSMGGYWNADCLSTYDAPDFDGSTANTQGLSSYMFGTTDLWNNGELMDDPVSTTACTSYDENDDDCKYEERDAEVAGITAGCMIAFLVVVVGALQRLGYLASSVHQNVVTKQEVNSPFGSNQDRSTITANPL